MRKYFKYLKYVIIHKWLVFWGCARYGLWWRGLKHDMSKLSRKELYPYATKLYSGEAPASFNRAWLHHLHRNDHHWDYWVLPKERLAVEMSIPAAQEMIVDWIAVGKQSNVPASEYYLLNRENIKLGPATRKYVESELGVAGFIRAETVIWKNNLA